MEKYSLNFWELIYILKRNILNRNRNNFKRKLLSKEKLVLLNFIFNILKLKDILVKVK